MVVLLVKADGRAWHVVGFAVYGASLVALYLASALNHSVHCSPRAAARLETLDYAAIFLLIAGTYTPLCLVNLRGPWGWGLLRPSGRWRRWASRASCGSRAAVSSASSCMSR